MKYGIDYLTKEEQIQLFKLMYRCIAFGCSDPRDNWDNNSLNLIDEFEPAGYIMDDLYNAHKKELSVFVKEQLKGYKQEEKNNEK